MKNKDYDVVVMGKVSHGRYGKDKYQHWCLSSNNKQNAIGFAYEILAGMSIEEICVDCQDRIELFSHTFKKQEDGKSRYVEVDPSKPIGISLAYQWFSISASVLK